MKRLVVLSCGLLVLVAGAVLLPGLVSQAQAQPGCLTFQAIAHAVLPSSNPMAATDTWGGPVFAMLENQPLTGVLSGNDGNELWHSHGGEGRDGLYKICFAWPCTAVSDSFTYQVPHAVFPAPTGQRGFMFYMGNTAKIVSGTGRFHNASGNLNVIGPAVAWSNDGGATFTGGWNPQITGKICGIE